MTLPWYAQPRDLLTRPRARMLSLDAVGALLVAWSLAGDDGAIRPDADASARELLTFTVASHALRAEGLDPRAAQERAERAIAELFDAARVVEVGGLLLLDGWVQLDGAPAAPLRPLQVEREPTAAGTTPEIPAPRRAPAERGGMSSSERSDRMRFRRREGRYAGVPAGVAYEDRGRFATVRDGSGTAPGRTGTDAARPGDGSGTARDGSGTDGDGSRAGSETSGENRGNGEKTAETERANAVPGTAGTGTGTDAGTARDGCNGDGRPGETVPVPESAPLDPRARQVFDAIAGDHVYRRVRRVALLAEKLATAYPHHDLVTEVRKASAWAVAKGRVVKAGTFLTTWMSNADPADPQRSGVFDAPDSDDLDDWVTAQERAHAATRNAPPAAGAR